MSQQVIELMKGWFLRIRKLGDFDIINPGSGDPNDPACPKLFYSVVPGAYSPVMLEQPDDAEPLGVGTYCTRDGSHCSPEGKVKGVVCKETPGGKPLYQGNVTNFRGKDQGQFEQGAHVVVVSGRRWRLYRLLLENKARIVNYTAFYVPEEKHPGGAVDIVQAFELA
jgi:hypothetical protein